MSSESQSPEPKLVAPDEQSSTESRFFELDVTGLTREEEARLLQRLTREITDAFPLPLMVRRTVVLPAGNQGERIAAVPDPIVVNPPPPGDAPQPEQPKRSIAELDTLRWLFTVVLGFALTNGTRIFWTGSLTDKELRSWSALYGSLDFAYFLAFVAEVIITALGGVYLLQSHYGSSDSTQGARVGAHRLRPILDAFVFVTIGILFNGVSFTLYHVRDHSWQYFVLFGAIFVLLFGWFLILAIGAFWDLRRDLRKLPRPPREERSKRTRSLAARVMLDGIRLFLPLVVGAILVWLLYRGDLHSTDILLFAVALDALCGVLGLAGLWFQ